VPTFNFWCVSIVQSVTLSFSSPPITIHHKTFSFSYPICSTVFQFTTHHNSVTSKNHSVSFIPSVSLSYTSHPLPFSNQYKIFSYSCTICPTIVQSTTHHHSLTIKSFSFSCPSVPLSCSTPPTTIH
jgi:hypothetical protein